MQTPALTDGKTVAVVSCRGLGRVQLRIWRAFVAMPEAELATADLATWAYPRLVGKPLHKHRLAIVRAAQRVATRVRRDRRGVVWRAKADASSVKTD